MKPSNLFDELMDELRRSFDRLLDFRRGENAQYEIKDAALSAFGIFFTQSRSFLAYQRMIAEQKGRSNVQSVFGAERIPSDNQIRNLLDPQEPARIAALQCEGDGQGGAAGAKPKQGHADDHESEVIELGN